MLITTFIVDDEMAGRDRLAFLIDSFLSNELEIIGSSGNPEEAFSEVLRLLPELVFMDIEMPLMSGIELSKRLHNSGFKGKIVFVTGFQHYSIKAIRANAFDYLLKPIDIDELKEVVERLHNENKDSFNSILIKNFELSDREVELIRLLAHGYSSDDIASKLFLSKHTVDTHRRNILAKTGAKNTIELLNLLRV